MQRLCLSMSGCVDYCCLLCIRIYCKDDRFDVAVSDESEHETKELISNVLEPLDASEEEDFHEIFERAKYAIYQQPAREGGCDNEFPLGHYANRAWTHYKGCKCEKCKVIRNYIKNHPQDCLICQGRRADKAAPFEPVMKETSAFA